MKKVILLSGLAIFMVSLLASCKSHEKCAAYGKYGYNTKTKNTVNKDV